MQRVLDPAQIEAFATQRAIPRIRLPDPGIFSSRAARLRGLSEGHAIGGYLRLMATLCEAQQHALERATAADVHATHRAGGLDERPNRPHAGAPGAPSRATHGCPPLLLAAGWPRGGYWREILNDLCGAVAAAAGFPAMVAVACERIQQLPAAVTDKQADLLLTSATHDVDAQAAPFIMAALQVYWVRLVSSLSFATVAEHVGNVDMPGVCPVCGSFPVASVVRTDKAYQGYRYLQCALCASEWHLVRIKCSHCESTEGIHYHSIEGGPSAVRAEACDRCRAYRKICYQEQDMGVEPLADDLGTVALDLLMSQEGFHRASGNPLLWQSAAA